MKIKIERGVLGWAVFWITISALLVTIGGARFNKVIKEQKAVNYQQDLKIQMHDKRIPYMVEYVTMVKSVDEAAGSMLSATDVIEVSRIIVEQCALNQDIGITPDKILALIERESGFDPTAISYANAIGLTQVTKPIFLIHAEDLGFDKGADWVQVLLDPIQSVRFGVAELIRLRRNWISYGVDSWLIVFTSYFWGEKNAWDLLETKRRAQLPSLEYGQGVIELSAKWREKGVG